MTEAALLAAILANPEDDAPQLIFADWLDERGSAWDNERAEFLRIRLEIKRCQLCGGKKFIANNAPFGWPSCLVCSGKVIREYDLRRIIPREFMRPILRSLYPLPDLQKPLPVSAENLSGTT